MWELAGLYVYSYLVGAVPTAYVLGRLARGIDIRQYGSGNVGGSNLAQHAGRYWVAALLIFDILVKGATPMLAGIYVAGLERGSFLLIVAPALAIVGHNWSPFMKLQGGRGISVVAGTLLSVNPVALVVCLTVVWVGKKLTKSSALWVLGCLAALPVWAFIFDQYTATAVLFLALLALTILKRVMGNTVSRPEGQPWRSVLVNRLLHDRDVAHRDDWVHRTPALHEM